MCTQRRLVVFAAAMLMCMPLTLSAQRSQLPANGTVLFICEHGSVRSVMATLMFDEYAKAAGLPMRAMSRGTVIDSIVPPWLQQKLKADQFTLGNFAPMRLSTADLANASLVISFDLPSTVTAGTRAPLARWDSLPSVSQNYVAGRDAIKVRVQALVDSMARNRAVTPHR